ncbi:efflux RND transporter periplasmic adaptor subunit [Gynuella sp.]|uniref:efflux RND transporter periplasmic adaptor subunit n=1 Tax=Gynuella sp. TaxID=2969146 RepID=UPI003D0E4663
MYLIKTSAVALAISMLALWTQAGEQLPFPVVTAVKQSVVREEKADAVVEAIQQATVSAQVSGRIIEVNVDVDDYVNKGSVIVRFRDTEQQSTLKSAQARYVEAEANYNRIQDVFKRKLASKSQLDSAEANFKAARATLEQAKEQLEHTVVRAPYSGIVVERLVEVGEMASIGQGLMTGISLERLRAVANVPQRYIDEVRQLGRARVIITDGKNQSIPGVKLTFSPYADPATHTFRVRVDLPVGQEGIYPGMYTKVAFVIGEEERLLVPTSAVVHRSEVTAVYVINDQGQVTLRQIRSGHELDDGHTEVLAGLQAGEQVAADPIAAGIYLKQQGNPAL